MPELEDEKLTLANMKGGAALEQVDIAIAKVLDNINDINTTLSKREITLKIVLSPTEDRTMVSIDFGVSTKMSGQEKVKFTADVRIDGRGAGYAIERNRQRELPLSNVIKMEGDD